MEEESGEILTSNMEESVPNKSDAATNTDEVTVETFEERAAELSQSPVFNIHIHVPFNRNRRQDKMYLPRIQPIIHMYFDEIAKKRSLRGQEINVRYLKTIMAQKKPKFGSILFHHESSPFRRYLLKNNIITSSHKRLLRNTRKSNSDLEATENNVVEDVIASTSEVMDESNCKNYDTSSSNDDCESTDVELSSPVSSIKPPLKLKRAVVVLEDILKTKSLRDKFIGQIKFQESETSNDVQDSQLNTVTNTDLQIKVEPSPSCSNSYISGSNEELNDLSHDDVQNSCLSNDSPASVSNELKLGGKLINREGVISLIDGCNFTELIQRFRRSSVCIEDLKKKSILLTENSSKSNDRSSDRMNENELCSTQSNTGPIDQEQVAEGPHVEKEENISVEKEGVEENENCQKGSSRGEQFEIEIQSKSDQYKIQVKQDKVTYELDHLQNLESAKSSKSEDNCNECPKKLISSIVSHSDDSEITTNKKLSSDNLTEGFDSAYNTSQINKMIYCDVNTNDMVLVEKERHYNDLNRPLERMRMSMGHRRAGNDKKRKSNLPNESQALSPTKKYKEMEGTGTKSEVKKQPQASSGLEDYIPLNVSKSTKFAVAPLPNIQAYKTHSAQTFKDEMLFGGRVARFSQPDQLQMYKLKKKSRQSQ